MTDPGTSNDLLIDDMIKMRNTLENARDIAEQVFGHNTSPEVAVLIYDRLVTVQDGIHDAEQLANLRACTAASVADARARRLIP